MCHLCISTCMHWHALHAHLVCALLGVHCTGLIGSSEGVDLEVGLMPEDLIPLTRRKLLLVIDSDAAHEFARCVHCGVALLYVKSAYCRLASLMQYPWCAASCQVGHRLA